MTLQPQSVHPHGLVDAQFDAIFTADTPIIVAYHGYPSLTRGLAYKRTNHMNMRVHGYQEEGTTTTPFDMWSRTKWTGSVYRRSMEPRRMPNSRSATRSQSTYSMSPNTVRISRKSETGLVRTNNRNGHSRNESSGSLVGSAKNSG